MGMGMGMDLATSLGHLFLGGPGGLGSQSQSQSQAQGMGHPLSMGGQGLGQGGLGMPRDFYLLPGEKYDAFRKAYRAYIQQMQELAGIPNASAKADAIFALIIRRMLRCARRDQPLTTDTTPIQERP